jgi:hypothetical protein
VQGEKSENTKENKVVSEILVVRNEASRYNILCSNGNSCIAWKG